MFLSPLRINCQYWLTLLSRCNPRDQLTLALKIKYGNSEEEGYFFRRLHLLCNWSKAFLIQQYVRQFIQLLFKVDTGLLVFYSGQKEIIMKLFAMAACQFIHSHLVLVIYVTWFSLKLVRHAQTGGSNLDLAHETKKFIKS